LHVLPHVPQFALSVCVLAQYGAPPSPPHFVWFPPHVVPHAPALQTSPTPHVLPHAPQFVGSFFESTQVIPHWVVPPPQLVAHAPAEQSSAALHAVPQAPQLS
jgi:hypothetical protein